MPLSIWSVYILLGFPVQCLPNTAVARHCKNQQVADAMTPVDLVQRDSISTELVNLLWLCYEHHGDVLFTGPTGVGKTTLMNAHSEILL